ncbi:methylated-DNA--[protein]-cysteine S-methyltransferase [Halovulum sp. GXIMD14793]
MERTAYHYDVMGRALAHIEGTVTDQPSLDEVAKAVGLSPAHFQRVFSQWVGVSPKRYQQYLTLDLAKRMLAERFTLLDTAMEAGLSGTSRLHDLFLRWEAMTPGEFAQGTEIFWDWTESPFGDALVMATDRGICGLAFTAETGRDAALADMMARWPNAQFRQGDPRLNDWLQAIFEARGEAQLHLIGAPFQLKVWEALLRIPTGHVTTYSEIAQSVGNPKAVRAVGTAVGRNPVSWLIPCHRALRKSGALGGYHWGLPLKRALLAWEAARHDAA